MAHHGQMMLPKMTKKMMRQLPRGRMSLQGSQRPKGLLVATPLLLHMLPPFQNYDDDDDNDDGDNGDDDDDGDW